MVSGNGGIVIELITFVLGIIKPLAVKNTAAQESGLMRQLYLEASFFKQNIILAMTVKVVVHRASINSSVLLVIELRCVLAWLIIFLVFLLDGQVYLI